VTYTAHVSGRPRLAEAMVEGVYEDRKGVYLLVTVYKQAGAPYRRSVRRVRTTNVVKV
jgi:hypothetical protein